GLYRSYGGDCHSRLTAHTEEVLEFIEDCPTKRLTRGQRIALETEITEEEITMSVGQLFRRLSSQVANLLCAAYKEAF
ncbi:hypothetical protein NDU88_004223, partial [Pleurodeles waltl]